MNRAAVILCAFTSVIFFASQHSHAFTITTYPPTTEPTCTTSSARYWIKDMPNCNPENICLSPYGEWGRVYDCSAEPFTFAAEGVSAITIDWVSTDCSSAANDKAYLEVHDDYINGSYVNIYNYIQYNQLLNLTMSCESDGLHFLLCQTDNSFTCYSGILPYDTCVRDRAESVSYRQTSCKNGGSTPTAAPSAEPTSSAPAADTTPSASSPSVPSGSGTPSAVSTPTKKSSLGSAMSAVNMLLSLALCATVATF